MGGLDVMLSKRARLGVAFDLMYTGPQESDRFEFQQGILNVFLGLNFHYVF